MKKLYITILLSVILLTSAAASGVLDDNSLMKFRFGVTSTPRELNYSEGLNSNIQDQIDGIVQGETRLILNTPIVWGEMNMTDNAQMDVGYIDFNLDNGIPQQEGRMVWNDEDGTVNLGLKGGFVNLQNGMELVVRGKNTSGGIIANGTAVRISGASGSNTEFGLSDADDPSANTSIGLSTEIIGINQNGYVTIFGRVRELDTTGTPVGESWSAGDKIWVSNTPGALTNVQPSGPPRKIFIGEVQRVNVNEGEILVRPSNIPFANELSGV